MSLKGKAKEVIQIIEQGGYHSLEGKWIDIKKQIEFSTNNTRTYFPSEYDSLTTEAEYGTCNLNIEVSSETTQIAASRLNNEGFENIVLLNFASARNPGGGFINGAKAQEEDLARCSTIYHCLISQMDYYEANRNHKSLLYTDHVIYSPKVPWFRTRSRDDPDKLYLASVITAPAPNANQALRRGDSKEAIEKALHRRCGQVLGIARDNNHKNIILGAWGCGVFGNEPEIVAKTFKNWLQSPCFSGNFNKVLFAVYDSSKTKFIFNSFKLTFDE